MNSFLTSVSTLSVFVFSFYAIEIKFLEDPSTLASREVRRSFPFPFSIERVHSEVLEVATNRCAQNIGVPKEEDALVEKTRLDGPRERHHENA